MPNGRPRREDIPSDVDPCDVLYELRLLDHRFEQFIQEFRQYRGEINGDHAWLRMFRTRMNEAGRISLVMLPVLAAAAVGVHLAT